MKDSISEIKTALKEGKVIIGTERTLKNLKLGKVSKIFLTSNCPEDVEEDVKYYSKLAKVEVVKLRQPNDELGALCKKPFSVSVLSVVKGA
jgi:large subunit ribosomal protein L30e